MRLIGGAGSEQMNSMTDDDARILGATSRRRRATDHGKRRGSHEGSRRSGAPTRRHIAPPATDGACAPSFGGGQATTFAKFPTGNLERSIHEPPVAAGPAVQQRADLSDIFRTRMDGAASAAIPSVLPCPPSVNTGADAEVAGKERQINV